MVGGVVTSAQTWRWESPGNTAVRSTGGVAQEAKRGYAPLMDLEDRIAHDRALKATDIFLACERLQVGAAQAARFAESERRDIEKVAGVRRPGSDRTWTIVVEMLAKSARARALCVTCGLGDPEGEVGPRLPTGHEGGCRR